MFDPLARLVARLLVTINPDRMQSIGDAYRIRSSRQRSRTARRGARQATHGVLFHEVGRWRHRPFRCAPRRGGARQSTEYAAARDRWRGILAGTARRISNQAGCIYSVSDSKRPDFDLDELSAILERAPNSPSARYASASKTSRIAHELLAPRMPAGELSLIAHRARIDWISSFDCSSMQTYSGSGAGSRLAVGWQYETPVMRPAFVRHYFSTLIELAEREGFEPSKGF